jgi:hypothetical protein
MTMAETGKTYDASGKSAAEIEDDITETRAEMGAVLDALEQRLAPRHLLEQGMDKLRDTMNGKGGGIIGETLRGHPVPLALIGAGIGWLLVAGTAGDRPAQLARRAGDRLADAARQVSDKTRDLAAGMTGGAEPAAPEAAFPVGEELAGYAYARTKPRVTAAAEAAAETAGRARQGIARAIEDHPLALGILGLMAGAALATMLPRSRIEERWIGPARESLRERAGELRDEAVDRAQEVAERAVDSVADALKSGKSEGSV